MGASTEKANLFKFFNCIHTACILPETEGEAPWQQCSPKATDNGSS
jgi:hypothetical protein